MKQFWSLMSLLFIHAKPIRRHHFHSIDMRVAAGNDTNDQQLILFPYLFPGTSWGCGGLFHRRRPPASLPSQFLAAVHSSKQRICSFNLDWTACSSSSVYTDLLKVAFSQNFISSASELLDMITLIVSLMTCDELILRSMKKSNPNKKVFLAPNNFLKSRDPLQPKKLNPVIFGSEIKIGADFNFRIVFDYFDCFCFLPS